MRKILFFLLFSTLLFSQSIRDGIYKYTVSWENIKSADVSVELSTQLDGYTISLKLETLPWLKPIYNLVYEAEIHVSKNFLNTQAVALKKDRKGEEKIRYLKNGRILEITRSTKKNKKEEKIARTVRDMLDPFSSSILAMLYVWDKNVEHKFVVTNGKTDYEIILTCFDVKKHLNTTEYRIKPTLKTSNKSQAKKFKSAEIILSDDGKQRFIKSISSKVFIGTVYVKLREFTPKDFFVADLR